MYHPQREWNVRKVTTLSVLCTALNYYDTLQTEGWALLPYFFLNDSSQGSRRCIFTVVRRLNTSVYHELSIPRALLIPPCSCNVIRAIVLGQCDSCILRSCHVAVILHDDNT